MGDSLEVKYDGRSINRLKALLDTFPETVVKEFKIAVEYTKSEIVKNFMTVQDGGRDAKGRYPKRTVQPGVRVRTGALRRGVNTTGKVEAQNGDLTARIYPPDNVWYGNILERNSKYAFLKPGFDKARSALTDMLVRIRGHFK